MIYFPDCIRQLANGAIEVKENSYVVYKGSEDAKKATLMSCEQLDPNTCTPAKSGVVFDVAGAELTYAFELRTFTGSCMCNILDTQSWILTDKQRRHILDRANDCFGVPLERSLSPTDEARLVRRDLHQDPVAHPRVADERFDVDDFHTGSPR